MVIAQKSLGDDYYDITYNYTYLYNMKIYNIHHVSKAWYFIAWYYEKKLNWTTELNRVLLLNIKTWLKPAGLQTVKTGKKGCVTPFYRIPRNKDRKRCGLTFLCRKTLPNIEYMYVCGEHFVTDKYIIHHKTVFHFPLLLEILQHNL